MENNLQTFNPSSKFWLNLFNNLSGMFFICLNSSNWDMVYISDGSTDLTGYNPNELLHNNLISYVSLIHPEDYDWLYEKCIKELNNKIACNNEYRIICKKGKVKWVKQIANGIYNDNGELLFIEGYIEDITAEKDTNLISKSFASYQDTINNTSIVSITDKKGKIIFANELFCKYSKYSRQELVGKSHKIINSGNHSKEFFSKMWKTINNGEIWRGEIKNKAKDGSFYWVDTTISPIFNERSEIERFLSIRAIITDKKEQEEKLVNTLKLINDEKDFNHNVFASLTSNIAIIDAKGDIIKTNKSWDDFYIQNNGNLENNNHKHNYLKTCLNSIKSGDFDAEKSYNGIKKVLKGKLNIFEHIYPCHSPNEKRWFLLRVTPYIGTFKGAVLSHYNITDQKEYQIKIEEITKKIQSIYDASIFVIMISTDKNGLVESINSGAEKILGYKESELINKPILNIYLDTEIKAFSKKLSKKYSKNIIGFDIFKYNLGYKKTKGFEFTFIKKDGQYIVVLLSVSEIKNNNGEITGYLITAIDISHRKIIEEKMKKKEKMLIEAQCISKVGSWEYLFDSNSINISKEIYRIHEVNHDKFNSNIDILSKYIHENDIEDVKKSLDKAQKNSKSMLITYRIVTPSGDKKWIERKEYYIRDKNNTLLGIKGTLQDITDIKKKELSQIKLVEELNKKNNELMQFNYIVSHNLRSPVAKIMSLTNLMNLVEDDEKNTIIDYLSISAKQLDEVIKDLNQILSSKSTINEIREKISFKEILLRIFDSLEKQILESNAIINTDIDNNFSEIITIKSYLESILYNLISNSIKYRSNQRQLEINIYINKTKSNFIINVIDNGIGIDLKRHNKDLFTLYKRFNYSVEGKGMGLHMTKNQVEALGGKISIASKLNEGTVITVILPSKELSI